MSGAYGYFATPAHIPGFTIMYGLFLSLGEVDEYSPNSYTMQLGPGICLGLLASKSSPTAFRGVFYGGAAAVGKVGAFAGTWAFPAIMYVLPAVSLVLSFR
ncbi:hypothetical protein FRC00_013447 [Tulasnella sp. 408]|nr:hypothetical protein FRC00_013447 [Tulasnella sp. 408]